MAIEEKSGHQVDDGWFKAPGDCCRFFEKILSTENMSLFAFESSQLY